MEGQKLPVHEKLTDCGQGNEVYHQRKRGIGGCGPSKGVGDSSQTAKPSRRPSWKVGEKTERPQTYYWIEQKRMTGRTNNPRRNLKPSTLP